MIQTQKIKVSQLEDDRDYWFRETRLIRSGKYAKTYFDNELTVEVYAFPGPEEDIIDERKSKKGPTTNNK